jgi:hypothetical protein
VSGNSTNILTAALHRWRVTGLVVVAAAMMGGCAANGDFGRVKPSLVTDDVHAWMGPAVTTPAAGPPWRHQLTDDERRLRDLAYPLIEPPYNRNKWLSVLSEYGLNGRDWPYPDRAAYASRLFQTAYRSQTARYNRLMEDIRNDVVRLDPFYNTAHRVADMDGKRGRALGYVSNLTQEEHYNTVRRMHENEAIVLWVNGSLRERAASYRVALERLVIAAPSPIAVEAERSLTLLEQRIARYGA